MNVFNVTELYIYKMVKIINILLGIFYQIKNQLLYNSNPSNFTIFIVTRISKLVYSVSIDFLTQIGQILILQLTDFVKNLISALYNLHNFPTHTHTCTSTKCLKRKTKLLRHVIGVNHIIQ